MDVKKLFAQIIMNAMLRLNTSKTIGRITFFLLDYIRQLIVRIFDPLISYDLFKTTLVLPFSHNLPITRKYYPYYSSNVGRIANYVYQKYVSLRLVDIGANIGDTVAILRNYACFPILCIEGSTDFFKILQLNTKHLDGIHSSNSFVSNANANERTSLAYNHGTAKLVPGDIKIILRSLGGILADFSDFENMKMLKVDTDGMDGLILKGAMDLLTRLHPVIFFEYDPYLYNQQGDDGLSLFQELRKIGYKTALVYDKYGDYLLSLLLNDRELIEDLTLYCLGSKGDKYFDICVFHEDDSDLAHSIRLAEIRFFQNILLGNIEQNR